MTSRWGVLGGIASMESSKLCSDFQGLPTRASALNLIHSFFVCKVVGYPRSLDINMYFVINSSYVRCSLIANKCLARQALRCTGCTGVSKRSMHVPCWLLRGAIVTT